MMNIQTELADRAIELLAFKEPGPKLVLDVGCGTGLSGGNLKQYLTLNHSNCNGFLALLCSNFGQFNLMQLLTSAGGQ